MLPEAVPSRYAHGCNLLFGGGKKDDDWTRHHQTVAEEVHRVIAHFASHEALARSVPCQMPSRVFGPQCDAPEERVRVPSSPGGNTITHPSDPDATLDGHKGRGFQIQISESCSDEKEFN